MSLALCFARAVIGSVVAVVVAVSAHGEWFNGTTATCTLSKATILFPRPYTTLLATADAASFPLPMVIDTDCPFDTRRVTFLLDSTDIGSTTSWPYTITAIHLADMNVGVHTLGVAAYPARTEMFTDVTQFILARVSSTTDANANGLPDAPFYTLNTSGVAWLARALMPDTGKKRMVTAIRWQSPAIAGTQPDVPAVLTLTDPDDDTRRITAWMPQKLLKAGESGIFAILVADDLKTLLGVQETAYMGDEPFAKALPGALYVAAALLISADAGVTYATAGYARIADYPIHIEIEGLTTAKPNTLALRSHPCTLDTRSSAGLELFAASGAWNAAETADISVGNNAISFDLLTSSVVVPYRYVAAVGEGEGEGEGESEGENEGEGEGEGEGGGEGEGEGEGGITPIDPGALAGISLIFVLAIAALAGALTGGIGGNGDGNTCFLTSLLDGTSLEKTLRDLRAFRDTYLRECTWGRVVIWLYGQLSPAACAVLHVCPGARRVAFLAALALTWTRRAFA